MSKVESPSVSNFVEPFMKFENELGPIINQLTFLQHVSSDKEIRDASVNSSMKLDELNIDLSLRHDIFLQFCPRLAGCSIEGRFCGKRNFQIR